MQKIVQLALVATAITLASCGAKSDNPAGDKQAKLAELKKQQASITAQIETLEKDIAKSNPAAAKEEKAKLVTLSTIAPEPFFHYIDLQGRVEAVNISYVAPKGAPGVVKAVYVKKGDLVKKGQLLLKMEDVILRQNVATAQQNLETLKTQLAYLKNLYQKQKNLWDQNIGTEVQLITAKNNVDNVESQLKANEEQIKIAKEQLNYTSVYSDVNGVAEDVNIRVGETFAGIAGTSPQIKIVNTADLKVTTQVPENYLGKVTVGTKVRITLPDINRTLDASISVAGKLIELTNRSFFAEARIPSDPAFHPNQVALVQIQDYSKPKSIIVPVNTIQSDDKSKYVMVAAKENGKMIAHKRAVVIGEFYGNKMEIKSGLQTGDLIVTDGFQSLYEGQLITTETK
jgi:RND family efflux transporter MFP subunit